MNVADLLDFLAAFGSSMGDNAFNPEFDFDGNGHITVTDLMHLLSQFDPFNGGQMSGKGSGGK